MKTSQEQKMSHTASRRYFKLVIEYDGTRFFGWQRQKDRPTIQGELEKALSLILNQEITTHGSGRTDAGVHATGQVASFSAVTQMEPAILQKGVNSLVKAPIVIVDCSLVNADFHARYTALSKTYHYVILNRPLPCAIGSDYLWHVAKPLDLASMNQCCSLLVGVQDFKSFENTGSPRKSTIREIFWARVDIRADECMVVKISASGFLKNMVRNIVGTLVDAGLGKISPGEFEKILKAKNRSFAGATAPAKGLFLKEVIYPGKD